MWQRSVACDPFNSYAHTHVASTFLSMGEYRAAIEHATLAMELVSHPELVGTLIYSHMAAGDFDAAMAINERYVDGQRLRLVYQFRVAAAQGDADTAAAILNERKERFGSGSSIPQLAMLGDRQGANTLAAEADAAPLGYLNLIVFIKNCACGAPFDLDVTPVFARMVEEAELTWPPPAPIKWPLKDW